MAKFDMLNQFVTHTGGGLFACPGGRAKASSSASACLAWHDVTPEFARSLGWPTITRGIAQPWQTKLCCHHNRVLSTATPALGQQSLLEVASVARVLVGGGRRVQQDVALDADLLDQVELTIEEVDVFLFTFQDVQQQVT